MKVLSSEGLTKLITLIKNNFIKTTDVEAVSELEIDSAPTSASANLVTSGGVYTAVSGKLDKNTAITGATKCKITYDAKGLVTSGADLLASDLPSHTHANADVPNLWDTEKTLLTTTLNSMMAFITFFDDSMPTFVVGSNYKVVVNGSNEYEFTAFLANGEYTFYYDGEANTVTINNEVCMGDKTWFEGGSATSGFVLFSSKNTGYYSGVSSALGDDDSLIIKRIATLIKEEFIGDFSTDKITNGTFADARIASASIWNAKQNALTTTQLNACNSGINASKVSTYDGYASQISGKQAQHTTETVTLTTADWSNKEQTVSVSGVTLDNTVLISPSSAFTEIWATAKIYCSAQGSGRLTFTCIGDVPSVNVNVNVVILP